MKTEKTATLLLSGLEQVIKGKRDILSLLITAYLTGAHVLLEDVPGLGKTSMIKALASLIEKDGKSILFRRIQCTPDLLPYDITGVEVFNPASQTFTFMEGPVFSDILLADELNRTPPKVQSALLEAMAEKQVTLGLVSRPLNPFFFTAATQNPVETAGTYPLPIAQLDRFGIRLSMGYPDEEAECILLHEHTQSDPILTLQPLISLNDVAESQAEQRTVYVHPAIEQLITAICRKTRQHTAFLLGASPRAGIHLLQLARTFALLQGRTWVEDADIRALAPLVLAHRCSIHVGYGSTQTVIQTITDEAIRRLDKKIKWTQNN